MSNDFPFNHFINFDNSQKDSPIPKEPVQSDSVVVTTTSNRCDNSPPLLSNEVFSTDEMASVCEEVLLGLKNTVTPQKYKAFFQNTLIINKITQTDIDFSVTTGFIKKMITTHYLPEIKKIVSLIMGSDYNINVILLNSISSTSQTLGTQSIDHLSVAVETNKKQNSSFKLNSSVRTLSEINDEVESQVLKNNADSLTKRRFDLTRNFDNFVVGPSNNMAYAFSVAVSKDPGKLYPQLYIHGNSGLGKTHLLHAICNFISEQRPHYRICFTNANQFMSEMVMAIQSTTGKDNKISEFRRKYTELVDILIIDDIHELKNKTRTQAEFFFIFNELQNKGKQLVFTSDKAPREIIGIEDRIRTRLSSALLIDIQQPDLETRIAILRKKASEKDIYLEDDIINLVASCVRTNVRELEGKLVKLGAYSDLMNVDIDLEIAKEQLNLSEDMDDKIITIESITKSVSSYYKITLGDIKGKSRKKEVALARHIAMFMCQKILKKTLEEIGEYFENRDHSTVIHGIKKIQTLSKDDNKISQQIYEIESKL